MKKTLASLLLATSLMTGCHDRVIAIHEPSASEIERPGQMTVQGSATLEVSPDCADLTITLDSEATRPGGASQQVGAKQAALIEALSKIGVAITDVKLSTLSLDPVFEQTDKGVMLAKVHGYRAQIVVTATTRDFTKIPDVMDAAAQAGSSTMSSNFRRSDLSVLKKQVRDMALAAAKDKAQQTANALGIKLGRVIAVNENQGGMMWSNQYFPSNAMAVQDAHAALGGTLQPLTLDVTVGYELAKET
ncbi:MAG: hypothetical protein JWO36_2220 [Myxococcales bacterium]|nr:hypothetical protein [Myxococcales bacterium]